MLISAGELPEAATLLEGATEQLRRCAALLDAAGFEVELAEAYRRLGRYADAERVSSASLSFLARAGLIDYQAEAQRVNAYAQAALGHDDQAVAGLRLAADLFELEFARTCAILGDLLTGNGDLAAAADVLRRGLVEVRAAL